MRTSFTYDGTPDLMSLFVLTGSRFTGKERDAETGDTNGLNGLDYFGARYYGSSMRRWMSPDWITSALAGCPTSRFRDVA